jgi:hypothetical protein
VAGPASGFLIGAERHGRERSPLTATAGRVGPRPRGWTSPRPLDEKMPRPSETCASGGLCVTRSEADDGARTRDTWLGKQCRGTRRTTTDHYDRTQPCGLAVLDGPLTRMASQPRFLTFGA